ncbi:MAG: tetratricopeptide repeat protein [Planctomycetota bacterium]|nr:tetratricopeptide repeat protein [Planctomycetota bacterium]MDA1252726.1 tetratricopeptide repeat protein [Planctomycetota bacterium]
MSRRSKRKKSQRNPKRRSGTAVRTPAALEKSPRLRWLEQAEAERNPQSALELFLAARDECQHGAAVSAFDGDRGDLWDVPDARPYLRAVSGIGASLWQLNRMDEAIPHFEELLQADTADHLLARYWLASCLLTLGRADDLTPVFDRYDEDTAIWRYARALWTFAVQGDTDESRRLLQEGRRLSSWFVDYVLGDEMIRADVPVRFGRGQNESHSTARLLLPAWRSVPGAVAWMRRVLRVPLGESVALSFPLSQLLDLPEQDSVWQVGLRELEPEGQDGNAPAWILGVADVTSQKMRCMTVIEGDRSWSSVWNQLIAAFLHPLEGEPACPDCIEVPSPEYRRKWRPMLDQIGVNCRVAYRPQPVSGMLDGMVELMTAQRLPQGKSDFDPRDVPVTETTWQIDFFHQPAVISNSDVGVQRPWCVLIIDKATNSVLCNELIRGEPEPELLWEQALRVMQHLSGRPQRVEVADSDGYDFLRSRLAAVDVDCTLRDELPELHAFCLEVASSFGTSEKCALASGQNVNRDDMESYYYAADAYFRQRPWRHVPGEVPIRIEVDGFAPRYGLVLGRTGVTLGLIVLDDLQAAKGLIGGWLALNDLSGLGVIFEEETILAAVDVCLIERNGWPVSCPEAYPAALRYRPGYEPTSPTARDLEFLSCCLHRLPTFVAGDGTETTYPPVDGGASLETRLAWAYSINGRTRPRPVPTSRKDDRVTEHRSVRHVNRKGDVYYLHEGQTKTGKPKYFFSKQAAGNLCSRIPAGFEVYENVRGQVFCRRIQPKLISDEEVAVVREAIRKCGKQYLATVEVKKKDIIAYERELPVLRFTLEDDARRLYSAYRWCFRGSIDDWLELSFAPKPLAELAARYCRHIGEESFYELM